MRDAIFEDPRLAEIYDPLDPDRCDLDAYAAEFAAESVVDVGCGTGTLACLLARRGPGVRRSIRKVTAPLGIGVSPRRCPAGPRSRWPNVSTSAKTLWMMSQDRPAALAGPWHRRAASGPDPRPACAGRLGGSRQPGRSRFCSSPVSPSTLRPRWEPGPQYLQRGPAIAIRIRKTPRTGRCTHLNREP